eukprot:scaffold950_cov360-Pavlova_lutheri.AAC.23
MHHDLTTQGRREDPPKEAKKHVLTDAETIAVAERAMKIARCGACSTQVDAPSKQELRPLCDMVKNSGRKSPGYEAESASLSRQDLHRPSFGQEVEQLAIDTVMWSVGIQPTNRTGLTLVLTPTSLQRSRA